MIKINFEKIVFVFLGLTFFIGTWHAFPMLNIINDEMYFVGGVLRAMENHTIIPALNDVPYGTLSYLLSYVISMGTLAVLLPFFKFSFVVLKIFLVQNPWVMYFSLRLLSAFLSLILLFFVNKIVKKEFEDVKVRMFLLVLLFTNMITTLILHTGKVWVLATLLSVISFYYLYKVVATQVVGYDSAKKNIFWCITFSFLAVADFPLNALCLLSIPVLFVFFWKDKKMLLKIVKYILFGIFLYLVITLLNFYSIWNQVVSIFVAYRPTKENLLENISLFQSLLIYTERLICLFPLLILTLFVVGRNRIKNINLFRISSLYFFTYFILITVVANWGAQIELSLRYLFPLGFFLVFIIASFDIQYKKFFTVIAVISIIFQIYTLYYLSIPTTYNNAYTWVITSLSKSDITIVNDVSGLQLIKNKKSGVLNREGFCASKCLNIIAFDLNRDFVPLVLDKDSSVFDITKIKGEVYYIVTSSSPTNGFILVKSFVNPSVKNHTVDYNMGNYFDSSFFKIKNLGENIYVYKRQ